MELGNTLFGISRGEYVLPNDEFYLTNFLWLVEECGGDDYGVNYENSTFAINRYYWGDCTCSADDAHAEEHDDECPIIRPNFLYKPTGFRIMWYKWPFRDSYCNKKITMDEFQAMINECVKSVREENQAKS